MASSPFSPRNPTGHPNMGQSARFDMMGPPTRNSFSSPTLSPSNFEHQLKHQQPPHSELKFQKKKSIFAGQKRIFLIFSKVQKHTFFTFSKVQKHIFCYF